MHTALQALATHSCFVHARRVLALTAASCAVLMPQAATAQDAATTLARMAQRSNAVVQARVLRTEPYGVTGATATFRVVHVLGPIRDATIELAPGSTFQLNEPTGRACGRAIHGLLTGTSCVVFLRRSPNHQQLRMFGGGARSIVRIEPGVVAHVTAIRTASSAGEVRDLLFAGLRATGDRIREDAAYALATTTGLSQITVPQRDSLVVALMGAIEHNSRAAAALLVVTSRAAAHSALPRLLEAYFDVARSPALDDLLANTLSRLDPTEVQAHLQRIADTDDASPLAAVTDIRAIRLWSSLPAAAARAALADYAGSSISSTRVSAGVAWLRLGLDTAKLASTLASPVEFDRCCAAVQEAPIRLRSIRRPGR